MGDDRRNQAWAVRADEVVWAIAAHHMLDSITVVAAAGRLLDERWEDLERAGRRALIDSILRHGDRLATMVGQLVRGLPPGAMDAIDLRTQDSVNAPAHVERRD